MKKAKGKKRAVRYRMCPEGVVCGRALFYVCGPGVYEAGVDRHEALTIIKVADEAFEVGRASGRAASRKARP